MKKLFCTVVFLCMAIMAQANAPYSSLNFDEETYFLHHAAKAPLTKGYFNEYIRQGETTLTYSKMLAVHHYPSMNVAPEMAAEQLGRIVQQINPQAQFHVIKNSSNNQAIVDFFTWTESGDILIAEFNIFKYQQHVQGQGLVAYQFVFRNDGSHFEAYADEFKNNRQKWVNVVVNTKLPELVEADFVLTQ